MNNPKPLTRKQKECVSAHYMNPRQWMLVDETEFYLKIINKSTGRRRTIDKFRRI